MENSELNFSEQVIKEFDLNEEERVEFNRIVVNHLANELNSLHASEDSFDIFYRDFCQKEAAKAQEEYERLVASSSDKVVQALKRYFQLKLAYYGVETQ